MSVYPLLMRQILRRQVRLDLPHEQSAFLWGPRRTGKSYWLRSRFADAVFIDLLRSDTYFEYMQRPALLRERYQGTTARVVIDEVQKVPALLDEVHWLIENRGVSFVLTGSSARKLRRGHANLLAGRAWTRTMLPLSATEVSSFDLSHVMNAGLLPPHYLSSHPLEELRAYVGDYLKEEIAAEAITQNLPAFSEFLRVAALTNAEQLNYTNVARECGVAARVVKTYFEILEDTFLGERLLPWSRTRKRRTLRTEKFYLFDVGVANYLARRTVQPRSTEFGKSFEHLVWMELRAYRAYRDPELDLRFFRTVHGQEVDFVLNDGVLAVEVKGSERVHEGDLRGLEVLAEEVTLKKAIVVCLEPEPRTLNGVEILPWTTFVERLWAGELTR